MNTEKIAIIAIIALGIAGSAALAAGGRLDPPQTVDGFESAQPPALMQNAMFEFLGM